MERETLSNNTEYQKRPREARIEGVVGDRANTMMNELMMVSDYESRQLQQQVRADSYSNMLDLLLLSACAVNYFSYTSYKIVSKQLPRHQQQCPRHQQQCPRHQQQCPRHQQQYPRHQQQCLSLKVTVGSCYNTFYLMQAN